MTQLVGYPAKQGQPPCAAQGGTPMPKDYFLAVPTYPKWIKKE